MPADDLQAFIRSTIKSVWALELLLLVSREPVRPWSADELNRELRGSLGLVVDLLTRFKHSGLVTEEAPGQYRYAPNTADLQNLVVKLKAAYAERPLAVVKAILAAPNEKIQSLADAFKVKKD